MTALRCVLTAVWRTIRRCCVAATSGMRRLGRVSTAWWMLRLGRVSTPTRWMWVLRWGRVLRGMVGSRAMFRLWLLWRSTSRSNYRDA